MTALDQHEQDRETEQSQVICLKHLCPSRFHLDGKKLWEILPYAPWLGSRLSVTFPVDHLVDCERLLFSSGDLRGSQISYI